MPPPQRPHPPRYTTEERRGRKTDNTESSMREKRRDKRRGDRAGRSLEGRKSAAAAAATPAPRRGKNRSNASNNRRDRSYSDNNHSSSLRSKASVVKDRLRGYFPTGGGEGAATTGHKSSKFLYWLRRNWMLPLILVVVIIATILFFALFTESCGIEHAVDPMPADIVFALDGSGSISATSWAQEKDATRIYVDAFQRNIIRAEDGGFQAGVVEWSTRATVRIPLQGTIDNVLRSLPNVVKTSDMTSLAPALVKCIDQIDQRGQEEEGTYRLCTVITDGSNGDRGVLYDEPYCQQHLELQGARCTVVDIAAHMKERKNIHILGIFVCSSGYCDQETVKTISSCPNGNINDCLYFQSVSNFQELIDGAEQLAMHISEIVNNDAGGMCLTSPSPLFLLPLLLPLLAYLAKRARKPLQAMKTRYEEYQEEREFAATQEKPLQPGTEMVEAASAGIPATADGDPNKKYKWDITYSDKYMWSSSGGGQMHVDYGKALPPPPSAPQDDVRKNRRKDNHKVVKVNLLDAGKKRNVFSRTNGGGQSKKNNGGEGKTSSMCPCCWVDDDEESEE